MIDSVDIKDISGKVRFSTPINKGAKRKLLLMKEDYITIPFSVSEPVYFKLGDGIDNELGIYELVDLNKPTYNESTGGYDYELRLDAYYWKWKNKKFFYTPENGGREASWSLTETLETHMAVFKKNLQALGYKFRAEEFEERIDETVEKSSKLITYDNCNLIDALTQMAETWECEWWIENSIIRFGRCEYNKEFPVDFKLNENVSSMERSDSQTTYATRIYAFGSARNIPASYRKSLIFDVKEIEGRDILDTARPLSNKFFPTSTQTEGGLNPIFPNVMHNFQQSQSIALVTTKRKIDFLLGGKYKIKVNSFSCEFLGGDRTDGLKDFIKLRVWLTYGTRGVTKQVDIFSEEKNIPQTPAGTGVYLDIPSKVVEFTLPDDCQNISIAYEWSTKRVRTTDTYNVGMFTHGYNPAIAYSNSIMVTFISGSNAGKSYQAVYNATFIPEEGNSIRLPEGIFASLGDRYSIDNIIKGKVPDSYFSKDDSEMTINSVVQKRLMLPADIPFIGDKDISTEEAVEEIVVFDDVYPRTSGTISGVTTHKYKDTIQEQGKPDVIEEWNAYRFKDNGITFSEDFRLKGQELRIVFQSGKLNGMDFAVTFNPCDKEGGEPQIPEKNADGSWNTAAQVWEIIRNEDYGILLPNDTLRPYEKRVENGTEIPADTYILYGFDTAFISEDMLPKAEEELKKKAEEYVKKSKIDPSTYNCKMMASDIYNGGNTKLYELGECVNLINPAYFPNGRQSRIIGFEWPLDIPYDHPVYTVGETAAYSRIGEIESKIDSLTYKGQTYSGSAVGGGGTSVYIIGVNDKTLPSDRNTFSAKRTLNEFVSKKNDDTIAGLLTFLKGLISQGNIEVGEFIDSLTSGAGIGLFPSGKIQASSVEIRDSLTVLELIFNRLSAQESDTAFSESGVIESIEVLVDGTYRLPLRKRWDTDFTAFDWNDIIYGSVNDLATGGGNYRTSWMRVVGVNTVGNYIEAVLYPHDEVPGGKNYPPEPLMAITRRGNTSDENRQSYWYISSYEKCICMLDGVTKPILEENNYSIIIGKMKQLSLFDNLPINYRQSYVYCRGLIRQDDIRIDVTGKPIYEFVNRGIWSLSVAVSEEPYLFESKNPVTGINETSTVYHRGTKWQCLKSHTLLEPKWNSTDWAFLEGNGEFSIDFESSKGFSFFYGLIDTVIEAKFFHGTADITEDVMNVPGTLITWSRDTGIESEDNAWSPNFIDRKNRIHLITPDMGSQWLDARSVTFKVTAVIPLGEENYLRESEELQFNL